MFEVDGLITGSAPISRLTPEPGADQLDGRIQPCGPDSRVPGMKPSAWKLAKDATPQLGRLESEGTGPG